MPRSPSRWAPPRARLPRFERAGGYFVEEVRRQLIDRFGESSEDGPFSVYAGGLWVRTSYEPKLQTYAAEALQDGLVRYDRGRGWTGAIRNVPITEDRWQQALAGTNIGLDYDDWRVAIVTALDSGSASLGFADGTTGEMPRGAAVMPVRGVGGTAFAALKVGDIIAVAPQGGSFALRSIPKVSGGFVVEEPRTGRVVAMQGGFDARLQSFNRATQALRQPGSTIKPIVYSAALAGGMTPASIIVDGPFCVYQGARLGQKCFRNFSGGGSGPHTMRWGIEQSRNLMTVRAAAQTGMDKVVDTIQDMGVSTTRLPPYLSYALGAGESTVLRMVNAYAMLVNHGRQMTPTLVDYVQNRRGRVIFPRELAAVCTLQHGRLGRQADAAPRTPLAAGDRRDDRVPDGPHHRGRDPARHRDQSARSRPSDHGQDRHLDRADRRVVRRRHAAVRRRPLHRL